MFEISREGVSRAVRARAGKRAPRVASKERRREVRRGGERAIEFRRGVVERIVETIRPRRERPGDVRRRHLRPFAPYSRAIRNASRRVAASRADAAYADTHAARYAPSSSATNFDADTVPGSALASVSASDVARERTRHARY